ncbi:CDP-glycerol glycerophosphotransferase family protein [Heyndrickxia camelliae]|uniref:CDP-glycerol--poly(Glycerophosphate) glycerophosphotransferase n=1 Tax=Heyndrickxia camelliae TaxID=1707093 RepID=A0A2N3LK23_9BACI|nr:CDP-glycerol glycerophosphotransferase family protein [Heyndrickxia camelliae]PKR84980.1 CDP-glycerol--poly(glycerophosphate) glycerophosphotransferase [Heyndrickxia camelliae]
MHFNQTLLNIIQIIFLIMIFLSVNKNYSKIKLLLKRSIVVGIYNASKLFPRSSKVIVFGAENGMGFRGNPKYLFLEMTKSSEYRCIWISKSEKVVQDLTAEGYTAYKHNSLKGIYYQLRTKLVVHSHSINDDFFKVFLGGATSYLTWHGVGLKKVWGAHSKTFSYKILHHKSFIKRFFGKFVVKTNLAKINYVVSTSPRVSSYYPETFLVKKENVIELGQVRNDIFFQTSAEDNEIPDYIKNNKVILYMPTHRNFGKLDTPINLIFDFEKLDQFCEKMGYLFIVKRHMYSSGSISNKYKHIIDVSDKSYDPQFLLKYADVLVTDYSSCYTDYLLLDRPVVFYCYDLELYLQKSNEMYFDYFDVTPGPKPNTFDNFLQSLQEMMENPNAYREERERVLNIFYSRENQGKVLEKQVNYINNHILKGSKTNIHVTGTDASF